MILALLTLSLFLSYYYNYNVYFSIPIIIYSVIQYESETLVANVIKQLIQITLF